MRHRSGLATGVYAGVYYLRGGLATFAFPSLSSQFGWRVPFIITAAVTAIASFQNAFALRGLEEERLMVTFGQAYKVIRSRSVLAVAFGIIRGSSVNYVVTQFLVTYAQVNLGYSATLVGAISSLVFIGAVIGGPIGGLASDRLARRRLMITLPAVGSALAVGFFLVGVPLALLLGLGHLRERLRLPHSTRDRQEQPGDGDRDHQHNGAPLRLAVCPGLRTDVSSYGYPAGWLVVMAMSLVSVPLIWRAREPSA